MPRQVKPCGTEAAYRRHLRNAETPCPECKRAAAEKRATRRGTQKKETADKPMADLLKEAIFEILKTEEGKVDYLGEYQRLYSYLNAALPAAMPREVSSLVREMRAILLELRTLEIKGDDDAMQNLQAQFQEAVASLENMEMNG